MRKLNFGTYAALIVSALFISCAAPADQGKVEVANSGNELEEITPLIETRVMLYDTAKLKNVKYAENARDYMEVYGTRFLSNTALNALLNQLKQTLRDPKALIYFDPSSDSTVSVEERVKLTNRCDSLSESNFDAKGNETVKKIFVCDSTSFWRDVNTIKFYESWSYNKRTGEIVKKQLGYVIWQWDEDKEAFRERYIYFTSKEARAIYLKNY